MDLPNVSHEIRDPKTGVTYRVMAYRDLTRVEVLMAVAHHKSSHRGKKAPKQGQSVTIITTFGHDR